MRWGQTAASLVLVGLIGCGGTEEDNYKLVRVSGTITRNGKPLAEARVTFTPDASNKILTPGVDETGPEGNYLLKFKGRMGVAPGKYKVIVEPAIETPSGAKMSERFKKDPMMLKFAQDAASGGTKRAEVKKEVFKGEFETEVPEASSAILEFDVKASSAERSTKK